jgi:thiol:disulfide interchange protein DsbD
VKHLRTIALLGAVLGFVTARADDFLPPEQAFKYAVNASAQELQVTWTITPGYYLYLKRLGFESATPAVTLGSPRYPKGLPHKDEYFGEQEIYRNTATIPVPFTVSGARPERFVLKLKWQGCADAGLCYPPTTWETNVSLPAATTSPPAGNLKSLLGLSPGSSGNEEFLPPDQAFVFSSEPRGNTLHLRWVIADGYYLYKNKISVRSDSPSVQIGVPDLPAGDPKTDEYFGTQEVYHQQVETDVPVSRSGAAATTAGVASVTYQGCAEAGLCYPPITKMVALSVAQAGPGGGTSAGAVAESAATPVTEEDRLAQIVRSGSLFALLGVFFVSGLALTFTPCVLPMIPILSGIIAGQGERATTGRSFLLSLIYVLAMALTYTVAGVLAGLFGQNLQAALQNAWVLGSFALIFVALAFSMFGFYELQMPAAIQERLTRLSNQQAGGTYVGVGVMGVLSALIVGPCVTAPLIAALVVIGQTGDPVRGGLALFALSMGMGTPLLLVGASLGKLLPRAGGWMETVKNVFGILLLGVALWFARTLLPDGGVMILWGVLAISLALLLGALDGAATGFAKAKRSVALLALVWGLAIVVGAAIGNRDPLAPLAGVAGSGARTGESGTLVFAPVRNVEELDRALAQARAAGKPALLDFSAEWCISCKEMEKYTFPDPAVQAALADFVLLRADVTANSDADQAMLKRFKLFGPPAMIFFAADGNELPGLRVAGYKKPAVFADLARRARDAVPTATAAPAVAATEPAS